MRPGQQNKRGRGRGNNNNNGGGGNNNFNRKGGNPLSRTYDSSGPDVKIRGTAQHIAEKYAALARDAQSSGDRVMAENYLQHAEHYNRIIAAAQAQMQDRFQHQDRGDYQDRDGAALDQDEIEAGEAEDLGFAQQPVVDEAQPQQPRREQNGQAQEQQPRENRRDREQRRDRRQDRQERREREQPVAAEQPQPAAPAIDDGSGPQPVIEGTPAEVVVEQAEQAEAAAPAERAPRRRAASRPRRQPRKSAEGDAAGDDAQPALAEAAGE
ncbi:protein of unknown function [Xaviernesmea oryzae]|uniref:DUF4167 domain-containing protein n=1 Tax=Xaviernesmea oryzae TaxID=464029 RepID=A0A1X7CES3_9HYPH|nr:DUF4167 domain-containing protein [Xaviernesmea oryzae]SME95371.1 protein of unknown function [Xaviernesmea oryzae]